MKSLTVYLKEYKKESILAPLFKLLEVVFDLLVPVVVAQIIDVGVAQDNRSYVVQMFFVLILMAGVGLACSFTAQFFAAKASCGFAAKLRQAMFDHIQSLSFTELDTMGTDTLITRLTDDVNQVQNGLNLGLRLLLRSPFVVLGSMVMAFTINVKCAWIFVIAIPVLFVVVFSIMLVSIPLFKKVQNGLDQVTGLTRENLTGVRVIRAFCREEQSVEEFEDSSRELTRLNLFVGRISALLNPVTYVLINIATVILIDRAGIQVNMGNMQQGEVVALYNYMLQIIVELIKLASLIITLNKSMACADRVAGILAVKSSMTYVNDEMRQKEKKQNHTPAVKFDHVTFTYAGAGAPSLKDISFQAMPGETIGIIGGTGSGKSTLVSLIPRFYDPQDGQVYMGGENVTEYTRKSIGEKVGIVQQRSVLFQGSIRDNLKWGDENATDEDIWKAIEIAQAKEVVEGKNSYRKSLQLEADDKVVHIERLRFADNEPVSLEHMFFSYKKYGFLLWEDLEKSVYSIIKERMKVDLTFENKKNRNILSVEKAGSRMAKIFGVAPSEPVFIMETLIHSGDDPVYIGKDYCLGSRFCYEVTPGDHGEKV